MFLLTWLVFLVSGVLMALGAVLWAVQSRQFEETDRARYLPLHDLSAVELAAAAPPRSRFFFYGNLAVLVSGALAIVVTLVLVLRNA
jgi:nitrogen fixation-related uncharacterized protein